MSPLESALSHDLPPLKLVISGPVGAGKTTFVRSLSETEVIDTDVEASEDIGKAQTTVALDFGTLTLGGQPLLLFGTPGQDRFDFMWEVLCEGALGLVMLVAGDRPQDFPKARAILDYITSRIELPFIVAVTRQDQLVVWQPEEVAAYFGLPEAQVVGLNATRRDSCAGVLVGLLERLEVPQPA